ncbi:LysM peptidoglycan-binding domain-containing protein [Chitinibacter fontanus]|uniref:LysM peptidoglycan-binding domain-containing protein n=1 Tax=Chitinibacter fontanus TaxID=1737446 RepID=A0A7D5V9C3_9NEIS|nr:LysM peptidoglycan-binding domain-containing protein [Chitinibacter fontanus]QLI81299.1 LysM peptidoglycan-binding domain-containing protein [Chitinibacter fontanus]
MFVSATYDRENKTAKYTDKDGNITLYIGGSFAWRLNNPGNMAKPGKRKVNGVIGYAQRTSKSGLFCIFESAEKGKEEKIRLIKEVYGDSTLSQMMYAYAPPEDSNDTEGYIKYLSKEADIKPSDIIKEIPPANFDKLISAIGKKEGFIPGEIVPLGKPVNLKFEDALKNPIINTEIKIKDKKGSTVLKTNKEGMLPEIFSSFFKEEIEIHIKGIEQKTEKILIGKVNELLDFYTIIAPFAIQTATPAIHNKPKSEINNIHIVKKGETLASIAQKYNLTVDDFKKVNNIVNENKIFERQHLVIPNNHAKNTATKSDKNSHDKISELKGSRQTNQRTESNHPVVLISSHPIEVSGVSWVKKFPTSTSLTELIEPFKTSAIEFIGQMRKSGISVRISTTYRPIERSYLMHYAAEIARKKIKPEKVPKWDGVNIDWCHKKADGTIDEEESIKAAARMVSAYGIGNNPVGKPAKSNHNLRRAVDMTISGYKGKKIKIFDGTEKDINEFKDLVEAGASYGVYWFGSKDKPHWSFNGR